MASYHRPRVGATLLALLFAGGTAYVLLEDVIRHDAAITTDDIQTVLALVGTIAAGHMFWPELTARRFVSAIGCALLFAGGTFYITAASGARNAQIAAEKALAAAKINADRDTARAKLADAEADLEDLKRDAKTKTDAAAKECATGKKTRCEGAIETRDYASRDVEKAESHVLLLTARLNALQPHRDASAGLSHLGRMFAAAPFVTADADEIALALALWLPFVKVILMELGTILFSSRAVPARRPTRPTPSETAQTSFPANDLGAIEQWLGPSRPPEPPKPGKRVRHADREGVVKDFVQGFRARHGRDPEPREVRQATGLPRASAHRWQRRVG
ncbi:MAG: hypothetical protein ACRCS9_08705 [Hyphomicrobium sp.]